MLTAETDERSFRTPEPASPELPAADELVGCRYVRGEIIDWSGYLRAIRASGGFPASKGERPRAANDATRVAEERTPRALGPLGIVRRVVGAGK